MGARLCVCEEREASWTGLGLVLGYQSDGFWFFSPSCDSVINSEGRREGRGRKEQTREEEMSRHSVERTMSEEGWRDKRKRKDRGYYTAGGFIQPRLAARKKSTDQTSDWRRRRESCRIRVAWDGPQRWRREVMDGKTRLRRRTEGARELPRFLFTLIRRGVRSWKRSAV